MRVLSVVHDPDATGGGGLFERVVVDEGYELERWVVVDGDAAPGDPAEWDAVMVFGGAMHPDQDAEHPWLPDEVGFIGQAIDEGVPTIGVCLGSQLIARACGAWVGPARVPEVGWVAVEVNDRGAADPVLGAIPRRVEAFQWHYYTFELPEGAVELACERGRPAGVPARRPDVGHPVPCGGRGADARAVVRRGRGRAPQAPGGGRGRDGARAPGLERGGRRALPRIPRRRLAGVRGQAPSAAGKEGSRDHSCQEPT